MNRRDTAIVAVILAVALAGGLGTVGWAVHQANLQQAEQLQAAQAAWNEAGAGSEMDGTAGVGGEDGESENAGGETEGLDGTSSETGESGDTGNTTGDSGHADGTDSKTGQSGDTDDAAGSSGDAGGATGGAGGSTGSSTAGQMPDLGNPPVISATGDITVEELVEWMTTQSSGALEAQALQSSEQALADGVGTAEDALRRSFASTQCDANYQARLNLLEQEAMGLAMEYLRCRDTLTLQEENLAYYQKLKAEIETSLSSLSAAETQESDPTQAALQAARKTCAEADLAEVTEVISEAQLSVKSAQADLDAAQKALNEAVGLSASDTLAISGELTPAAMPDISQEEAVTQGLSVRNEIKIALYAIERAQKDLTTLRYQYAPTSSEVQKQQAELEKAQADYPAAQTSVEADIIDRFTRLGIVHEKIALYTTQVKEATPPGTYELQDVDSGSLVTSNLSELMESQNDLLSIQIQLVSQTALFNQEVAQFQDAIDVGTAVAEI